MLTRQIAGDFLNRGYDPLIKWVGGGRKRRGGGAQSGRIYTLMGKSYKCWGIVRRGSPGVMKVMKRVHIPDHWQDSPLYLALGGLSTMKSERSKTKKTKKKKGTRKKGKDSLILGRRGAGRTAKESGKGWAL